MLPELFSIPFINISIKSYGAMMVLGFLLAFLLARYHCHRLRENPDHIANFGVYAMLAGVLGARLFHVLHNWGDFRDNLWEVFSIWSGGLEFLGGFGAALIVMLFYFRRRKLPILKFLDILAPAMMLGLALGRMGCFLNGCCFGAPCELPWAIRFPATNNLVQRTSGCDKATTSRYSIPFDYQLIPDQHRGGEALLQLPDDYYDGYTNGKGLWAPSMDMILPELQKYFFAAVKPADQLTVEQLEKLNDGTYQMLPIHPAQLYSLFNALVLAAILFLLIPYRPFNGWIFSVMLILYGITRFFLESLRSDSPLEFDGLTISQNLSLIAVPAGIIMMILCRKPRIPQ